MWPTLWQALHWNFLVGHWNPSKWAESPHLGHLSLYLCASLGSKFLLNLLDAGCSAFLWWDCLGLMPCFLFLFFPDESSVHWQHSKLIWAAYGSLVTCLMCLVVAFELSNFFASWHTLLAGNLSRSTLPSLIVLETKSPSFMKNHNMSWCKILAVSGGYLARLTWACTALYYSSMLLLPWQKHVSKSKLTLTSLECSLQNFPNLSHMVPRFNSSLGKPHDTYWSIPKSSLQAITFLHCCFSCRAASSHSRMFLHFNLHLRKAVA